jgi:hypothetical protein
MSYNWPFLPLKISGVDYDLIQQIHEEYTKIEPFIINIDYNIAKYKSILKTSNVIMPSILDSPESNLDYERLIPPYNIPCSNAHVDGCPKKAAFKYNSTSKYYCWFHVNNA